MSRAGSHFAVTHVKDKRFFLSSCEKSRESSSGGGKNIYNSEKLKESRSCDHKLHIHSCTVKSDLSFCFDKSQKSRVIFGGVVANKRVKGRVYEKEMWP